jgi:hypothetical protein
VAWIHKAWTTEKGRHEPHVQESWGRVGIGKTEEKGVGQERQAASMVSAPPCPRRKGDDGHIQKQMVSHQQECLELCLSYVCPPQP